jgi:hypothetical protein
MSNQLGNSRRVEQAWKNLSDASSLKYNSRDTICKNLVPSAHHNLEFALKYSNDEKYKTRMVIELKNKSLTQTISLCKKK